MPEPMDDRPTDAGLIEIPARGGVAAIAPAGSRVRIVNTHGTQVVDFWAFNQHDLGEFLSMPHLHVALGRLTPRIGDGLVTNRRRPILTVLEDTSPGVHDTLIAACDRYRYEQLGAPPGHANCTDNLASALAALGLVAPTTPAPLNVWMNIPVGADGSVDFQPTVARPGDHLLLAVEIDAVVVFSACPQDLVPINGADCVPVNAHYAVETGPSR
jgi:uncharacterized protein YcgI (DUF1989 family)